jgi:hypothetical protein
MNRPSHEDYCQYLLSCQGNYTLTHYAEHVEGLSHDAINRYAASRAADFATQEQPSRAARRRFA